MKLAEIRRKIEDHYDPSSLITLIIRSQRGELIEVSSSDDVREVAKMLLEMKDIGE